MPDVQRLPLITMYLAKLHLLNLNICINGIGFRELGK
jgi:hypothetical protein